MSFKACILKEMIKDANKQLKQPAINMNTAIKHQKER